MIAAAAACAGRTPSGRPSPPPILPADAVGGLRSDARVLGVAGVASDATDPDGLAALLDGWGFVVASQREFHGMTDAFNRVVARVVVFEDETGAGAYLAWLGDHADQILGPSHRVAPLEAGSGSILFRLDACGTCHAELPTFLAAWRRGSSVRYLLAAGPGASRRALGPIATALGRL